MEFEQIIQKLIIIHAVFGGIALLAGGMAISVRKGSSTHKKSGKVFFFSMLFSAAISLIVALLPNHENPFLFSIGIFSAYFLISGYRSLRYKNQDFKLGLDRLISYILILTGISMIIYPLLNEGKINIVLLVFGIVSLIFGGRDLMLYQKPEKLRKDWLKLHLGKMTGGYIAAMTAFIVVNEVLPGILNWFAPGLIGGFFIAYWLKKVGKTKTIH